MIDVIPAATLCMPRSGRCCPGCLLLALVVCWSYLGQAVKLEGGSALAMAGKRCTVLAMDSRIGSRGQLLSQQNLAGGSRVLKVHGQALLGMVGYDSLIQAFFELLRSELTQRSMSLQVHSLGRSSAISPRALSLLVSHMLFYEFRGGGAAPIIAGLECDGTPLLCTQDSLGAWSFQKNFAAIGSSAESVLGVCEALYQPDLDPEALAELASRCLQAGLNRDCQSGYGMTVYVITPNGVSKARVAGRLD